MTLITFGQESFVTKKNLSLSLICEIIAKVSPWLKPDIKFNIEANRYECYSRENLAVFAYTSEVGAIGYDGQWIQVEYVEEI